MLQKPFALMTLLLCSTVFFTDEVHALPDDQYQPIEIQADSAIRHEKDGLTTYQGNVFMKQGSLQVEADTITVTNVSNSATRLLATGKPARFQQQPSPDKALVHASANVINYELDSGRIELNGEALLTQGDAKISSDKIVYLSNEQVFKAEKDNTTSESKPQRVQVIIPAKKKPEDENSDKNTDTSENEAPE